MSSHSEYLANLRLEYQEISHWARHTEVAWWAVIALLISITAAAIYRVTMQAEFTIADLMGLPLIIIWFLYISFTKLFLLRERERLDRLREIETDLKGMNFWKSYQIIPNNVDEQDFIDAFFPNGNSLNWRERAITYPLRWMFPLLSNRIAFYTVMSWIFVLVVCMWVLIFATKLAVLIFLLRAEYSRPILTHL